MKQNRRSRLSLIALLAALVCLTALRALKAQDFAQHSVLRHLNEATWLQPTATQPDAVEKYFRVSPSDQKPASSATCVISNACISVSENGAQVLVPANLITSSALAGCTASGLTIRNPRDEDKDKKRRVIDRDLLLGFFPTDYAYQFPHFVLLGGVLLDLAQTMLGNRQKPLAQQYHYHVIEASQNGELAIEETLEPSLEVRIKEAAPAVLVHAQSVVPESIKMAWIPSFLKALFVKSVNGVTLIAPTTEEEILCFRSIWLPDAPVNSKHRISYDQHVLFDDNNLVKTPRPDFCSSLLRVTFLNRKSTRSLSDTAQLYRLVREGLQGTFKNIEIKEVFFEKASFDEQVAVMQETDVLVGVHGAGLANALFMRKKTYMLEIIPFGYGFDGFQSGLKSVFDVQGNFVVSEPDFEGFDKELAFRCPEGQDCQIHADQFRRLAKTANTSRVNERLSYLKTYPDFVDLERSPIACRALRAQNIVGDISAVRGHLKAWSQQRCGTVPAEAV